MSLDETAFNKILMKMCPKYNKIKHISLTNVRELDLYCYRQRDTKAQLKVPMDGWRARAQHFVAGLLGWIIKLCRCYWGIGSLPGADLKKHVQCVLSLTQGPKLTFTHTSQWWVSWEHWQTKIVLKMKPHFALLKVNFSDMVFSWWTFPLHIPGWSLVSWVSGTHQGG